jgi:hypothetical protein
VAIFIFGGADVGVDLDDFLAFSQISDLPESDFLWRVSD